MSAPHIHFIGFRTCRYTVLENIGVLKVWVTRSGVTFPKASVKYKTEENTAKKGEDFEELEGTLVFEKDEKEKAIDVTIKDDAQYEDTEDFYVVLYDAVALEEGMEAKLGTADRCTIAIVDDDEVQVLKFEQESVTITEKEEKYEIEVKVLRQGGVAGVVTCKYACESMGAVDGFDYEAIDGTLEIPEYGAEGSLKVTILPSKRLNKAAFNLVISDVSKGAIFDETTDGGDECCICHVDIQPRSLRARTSLVNRMKSRVVSANAIVGKRNWGAQFYDAIFKVVDDDDDDDGEEDGEKDPPTPQDWFFHIISLPWKLLFATVPPTDFCGGWACFCGSLAMIAVVTALVGDMANMVGSCMGIHPEITAVTFVALGTSLPDTFASMTAAQMDPYADASIGNVTGSNSVNVFLGIGISWLMAAVYWKSLAMDPAYPGIPTNEDDFKALDYWLNQLPSKDCDVVKNIGRAVGDPDNKSFSLIYVTPAGTMGLNLAVFSINAFAAIWHLFARRKTYGGELGGPKKAQYFSGAFLGFQWFIYILACCIIVMIKDASQSDDKEKNGFIGCGTAEVWNKFSEGRRDR